MECDMKAAGLWSRLATFASNRAFRLTMTALAAIGLCLCYQTANRAAEDDPAAHDKTEEYGEFLARPDELASYSVNRIARSLRLRAQAMKLGQKVYDQHCASCHGADLKGIAEQHTPDLTDAEW